MRERRLPGKSVICSAILLLFSGACAENPARDGVPPSDFSTKDILTAREQPAADQSPFPADGVLRDVSRGEWAQDVLYSLDELMVYPRALTADEILWRYLHP